MNEEQLEASQKTMDDWNKRHNREMGHRYGRLIETRKQSIKRLRRWGNLPSHYPDHFTPRPGTDFKIVSRREVNGVELFVSSVSRQIPEWNWNKTELAPFEDWPSIIQYNGYCRFKRKPVYEAGYNGLLSYVPVHGGITYFDHKFGVSVYGFDTAHADDESNPLVRNVEWVEFQCKVMAESIRIAARFEPDYLRFKDRTCRAVVIDRFHKEIQRQLKQPFDLSNNFGAMINVMFGEL